MRSRALALLTAAVLFAQGAGCCRCCRCFRARSEPLPPPADVPREERIPPGVLRGEGTPANLPKPATEARPTGAYGGT